MFTLTYNHRPYTSETEFIVIYFADICCVEFELRISKTKTLSSRVKIQLSALDFRPWKYNFYFQLLAFWIKFLAFSWLAFSLWLFIIFALLFQSYRKICAEFCGLPENHLLIHLNWKKFNYLKNIEWIIKFYLEFKFFLFEIHYSLFSWFSPAKIS